ncbi:CehA/McbA family metallohydrolase [Actinocrispum wychmicini]|uniref:CehA/McbA family metallohydrolase n=1 Tax=Actinocrispum wychmicini TaxID=1213861 RepID=UPI001FB71F92|nr:CehA/McbA family metallohydrolase [Actinocrispum wychmicini]
MTSERITGWIEPGADDWVYVPIDVPPGAREIEVAYTYDRPAVPPGVRGNSLDIGIFGPDDEFRGWSGGARDRFAINASEATPGYLPGPVWPGRWQVVLGPYTVSPQGISYELDITIHSGPDGESFRPRPAPARIPGRGHAWYRGDGHLHTIHSDGQRTLPELVADARQAGLDFVVSTEHNTSSAHLRWGHHATDDLLILNGEEVTTRTGHWPAWHLPAGKWIDWRHRADNPDDLRRFVDEVRGAGGLVVAAHPFSPCVGCSWEFGMERVDLVEVWNGPWTLDDEATVIAWDSLLRAGRWVPAVGNSDSHSRADRVGLPHNVVWSRGLSGDQLMAGFAQGRNWIAESAEVRLDFTATTGIRTVGIGQRLETDDPVTFEVRVEGAPDTHIRMLDQTGPQWGGYVHKDGGTASWTTRSRYSRWVRVEVRRNEPTQTTVDTMVALTNPIFLG